MRFCYFLNDNRERKFIMSLANKGSQYQLQKYVNDFTQELNNAILQNSPSLLTFINDSFEIQWKSSLMQDGYYEYQDDFLMVITKDNTVLNNYKITLQDYWPRRGPVWDGIATVTGQDNKNGLLLVEAKAHISETTSQIKATSEKSRKLIQATLQEVQAIIGSTSSTDPWLNDYYQLANRLSFLHLLNEKLKIPTWLVLCNFVNDDTHISTDLDEWLLHYHTVFNKMGIDFNAGMMSKVLMLFIPGKEEE